MIIKSPGRRVRYNAKLLFCCVVIRFDVACGSGEFIETFGKIMRRVSRTLSSSLKVTTSQFETALTCPLLPTISRARFYLDCAFMTHMRSVHARLVGRNGVVFGQWDSSPQGGRNWFMHEYDAIQEYDLEHMENVVMMLRELRESVEDMVNDGELCDFSKRHEHLVMFIKERISTMSSPKRRWALGPQDSQRNATALCTRCVWRRCPSLRCSS